MGNVGSNLQVDLFEPYELILSSYKNLIQLQSGRARFNSSLCYGSLLGGLGTIILSVFIYCFLLQWLKTLLFCLAYPPVTVTGVLLGLCVMSMCFDRIILHIHFVLNIFCIEMMSTILESLLGYKGDVEMF